MNFKTILLLAALNSVFSMQTNAQENDTIYLNDVLYKITKNDESVYVGYVLETNDREILLKTEKMGRLYIPKHEIKSIAVYDVIKEEKLKKQLDRNLIASRYIQTTNGFPVKKGEGYLKIMPVGLDFQLAITDKWSIGGMTSWIGIPLVLTSKYSHSLSDRWHVSAGILYTNLFYSSAFIGNNQKAFSTGAGILFGNVTFGNENANLNLSAGYGFTHVNQSYYEPTGLLDQYGNMMYDYRYEMEYNGTALFSLAGIKKVSKQVTLVFDSVINFNEYSDVVLFAPAVRFIPKPINTFQFGIGMAAINGKFAPIPIPMLSYHRILKKG